MGRKFRLVGGNEGFLGGYVNVTMRCDTCVWFVLKGATPLGRCRRRAPTLSGYPAAFSTDWCGDHKLDENKL